MTTKNILYSAHKSTIRNLILANKYDRIQEDLNLREDALAAKAYDLTYSTEQIVLMRSLQEGALEENRAIQIAFVDENGEAQNSLYTTLRFIAPRRIFAKHKNNTSVVLERKSALAVKILELVDDKTVIKKDRQAQHTKIDNALEPYRTISSLRKDWPEIDAFVLKATYRPESKIVVKDFSSLNNVLDLPPEKVYA